MSERARHRIAVVLLEQVLPLDFAIPMHVFAREAPEFYDVTTATADGGPVGVAGGLSVVPDGGLERLRRAETVIVPGYGGAAAGGLDRVVLDALAKAAGRGARMVSICSGTFALAQAGLLAGLTVTTHWSLCAELARQYPGVTVDPAALFVDNGSVLTSGGVTAGVDLALHVLRQDLGASVANHVGRRILATPRREGEQAQFIETPPVPPGDDALAAAQQWMLSHLDEPVTVARMAARAHLSPRHFHRLFLERTSVTPLNWLHQQRIGRTKELLETTTLTVEEIANRVGLGTPANLRQHFRRATSLTPVRYRQLFPGVEGAAS
ncbi:helix-turn-helix domain-containing protein [Amycolatopsis sp. PS_44_ISF1]|uniref:GlxA family transcriptional regulator n=1 Tax=Amycolatopsis sp. PS_44_ISF1 TaxID=2974917 RepID=UPI0028DE9718|nr:helix-turn-helix domain-containing protein [Amycolatopsis sp. PS_44_ISF1]MDT8911423.1 DJ-1/PfpI family protein [Amycolatopsis sp. PS_44_ISF1]